MLGKGATTEAGKDLLRAANVLWRCAQHLCASCGSSHCCILHDLQFVNAGDCLIGSHVYFCLPHPVAVSVFIICSGLCAFNEMLSIVGVLYVNFWSKVRSEPLGVLPWVVQSCLF